MKRSLSTLLFSLCLLCSVGLKAQSISGPSTLCDGSSVTMMGTPAGGTWSTSIPPIATVGISTGIVTGISVGTVVLTYTTPSSAIATYVMTVNPTPSSISGTASITCGSTATLATSPAGGTWSSSNVAAGTVNSTTGVWTGVSAGTANISYTLSTGCSSLRQVTVNPFVATISGSTTVCAASSVTLSGWPAGGTWSTSGSTAAISAGVVTGVTPGAATITYSIMSACGIATTTYAMTVMPVTPIAPITGTLSLACGSIGTLSCITPGGTWTSYATYVATVDPTTGVVAGLAAGTASILYSVPSGCGLSSNVLTITPSVSAGTITGTATVCIGSASTLASTVAGGLWMASNSNATVSMAGVVTGVTAGIDTLYYVVTTPCGSDTATYAVTITTSPSVAAITGPGTLCVGDATTFSSATPGGVWSSSSSGVVTVAATSGGAYAVAAGSTVISYSVTLGCGTAVATLPVTVTSGTITATSAAASCGEAYLVSACGATSYSWAPTTGVTCPTCASTSITASATTTYTVTGTTGGCTHTATVTVNGNRIHGHVLYGGTAPTTATSMVWLIQYNPADSSIIATDSTNTCNDGTGEYYNFDGKPAGNYLVKAKLLSATAGTSGYMPTYGASATPWYMATSIAHGTASDAQDINMIYGTVPSGPGFISGYVYAGAGKGTSGGAPVKGMLVYLKDATTGNVLTYTYTDATGLYLFTGLGYGSYIVYPEAYHWNTTPSGIITLAAGSATVMGVTFKQYSNLGIIAPYTTGVRDAGSLQGTSIYPNPAKGSITIEFGKTVTEQAFVTICDAIGSTVYTTTLPASAGRQQANLPTLPGGMYIINIRTGTETYTSKLVLE